MKSCNSVQIEPLKTFSFSFENRYTFLQILLRILEQHIEFLRVFRIFENLTLWKLFCVLILILQFILSIIKN